MDAARQGVPSRSFQCLTYKTARAHSVVASCSPATASAAVFVKAALQKARHQQTASSVWRVSMVSPIRRSVRLAKLGIAIEPDGFGAGSKSLWSLPKKRINAQPEAHGWAAASSIPAGLKTTAPHGPRRLQTSTRLVAPFVDRASGNFLSVWENYALSAFGWTLAPPSNLTVYRSYSRNTVLASTIPGLPESPKSS